MKFVFALNAFICFAVCRASTQEIYRHVGCFHDGASTALPHILGLTTKVQECYKLAVSSGYKVFGFKLGQVCVSGKGVTIATFVGQRKSNQCRNGRGHLAAVDVYKIASKAIKFFVDRVGGRSCDQVCEEQGRVCQGTNQAIPSDALPAFREAGVDCQFDAFHDTTGDAWQFSGDPKYGIGGLDDGICKGFKNVPRTIYCDAKPFVNYGRLCPCHKTPQCKPIKNVLVNGRVNLNGTHASFSCDAGYTLQGPKIVSCKSGIWTPSKPSFCIEIYRHVGCFHDGASPALPHVLAVTTNVQKCYKLAVSSGYKVFAFRFGQICMSAKGVTIATFARQKKLNQCRNGLGHLTAVDVYGIVPQCKPINVLLNGSVNLNGKYASFSCDAGYTLQGPKIVSCINGSWTPSKPSVCREIYRHAGCFQDGANSVLSHILGVTTKIQECYKLAVSSGYKVFGFKFGQICMSGKGVTIATFARQKKSNQCRNGLGHLRAVDVYGIADEDYTPCGVSKTNFKARIVGGNEITRGTWPWQVGLYQGARNRPHCGGSLINKKWVLTAAHCFVVEKDKLPPPIESFFVQAGHHKIKKIIDEKKNTGVQTLYASEKYIHQDYNAGTLANDIALIKLEKEANLNRYVRTVCLPENSTDDLAKPGTYGFVAGWGVTKVMQAWDERSGPRSNVLLHTSLPIQDNRVCKSSTSAAHKKVVNMTLTFCAGDGKGNNDSCKGDSGGPFVREKYEKDLKDYRWTQVGIVSLGEGCGLEKKYGFYTRVAQYIDWIHKTIKEGNKDDDKK